MKRLVAVVSLILCLSFPIQAGHVQVGGGFYCECDDPTHGAGMVWEGEEIQQYSTPGSEVSELDLFFGALLMLVRF